MERIKAVYPYITGLAVGFVIIPAFALGFNFSWSNMPWVGSFLMAFSMLVWPVYLLLFIGLRFSVYRDDSSRQKQWFRSLFLPPLGAIISLLFVTLIYTIFN